MKRVLTCAQTNITLVAFDELHGQVVESVEIVAGVGNPPRFIAKPSYRLQDALKILAFLSLRIRVVISKVCFATMMSGVTKIHENGFGMSDVEISVWLRREACPDLAAGCQKMLFS